MLIAADEIVNGTSFAPGDAIKVRLVILATPWSKGTEVSPIAEMPWEMSPLIETTPSVSVVNVFPSMSTRVTLIDPLNGCPLAASS